MAANNAVPVADESAPGGRRMRRDPGNPALASLAGLARRLPLVLDLADSQPQRCSATVPRPRPSAPVATDGPGESGRGRAAGEERPVKRKSGPDKERG